jgi:flavin-dependent dehydrogenase
MEREGFIRKHGVSWTSWLDHQEVDLDFDGLGEPEHAFQVERSKFDDLLLKYAREHGTRVFSGAQVDRIDFNRQGQASGVTVKVGESKFSLKSRLVVDASGRPAVLGHQLKLLKMSTELPRSSVHSWFANVARRRNVTDSFTNIHLLPFNRGWAWEIQIDEDITSVGLVMERAEFVKSGEEVNQFFQWAVNSNPVLAERMKRAERLREFRMDSHQSYAMEKFAGEGWLMVGDAAFFTDPIFASGISDGMHSAKFAADAIIDILTASDGREARLASYDQHLRSGALRWQELTQLFYEVAPVFARVVADSGHRHQFLRLCEGEVYDSSAEQALALLRKSFDEIRESPDHPFHQSLVKAPG